MAWSSLNMKCPKCGEQDEHRVVRTDPAWYHWDEEHEALFKRIAGDDISFRERTKLCRHCGKQFVTCEMANKYLRALVREVDHLLLIANDYAELRNRLHPSGAYRLVCGVLMEPASSRALDEWIQDFTSTKSRTIKGVLNTLKPREKAILDYVFGVSDGYQRTLGEISKILHSSRANVRSLLARTMNKLRQPSRFRKLEALMPDIESNSIRAGAVAQKGAAYRESQQLKESRDAGTLLAALLKPSSESKAADR